ncbi:hypothetical protein ACWEPB_28270 [Kitasatospora cineracea]
MAAGNCMLCGVPVDSKGEHVFPRWLYKRWKGQGPFTIFKGAEPTTKANGKTERGQLARVMLPMCGTDKPNNCNGWLEHNFERPGKLAVRSVIDELQPITGDGVTAFARWVAKTMILHSHPLAEDSEIGHLDLPGRGVLELPDSAFRRLRESGQFPEDLSVWMAVSDPAETSGAAPAFERFLLPRTDRPDGAGGRCGAAALGLSLPNGLMMTFQVVFHPLVDIVHPFEASGQATRLWPNPPAALDIKALPILGAASDRAMTSLFISGGGGLGLLDGERLNPQHFFWPHHLM